MTKNYFEKMAGILNTKGKLAKAILEERAKEKKLEEKKRIRIRKNKRSLC